MLEVMLQYGEEIGQAEQYKGSAAGRMAAGGGKEQE